MKFIVIICLFHQSISQYYKPSENYKPIRHQEEETEYGEIQISKAVAKMQKIMGYNIPVDSGIVIKEVESPWLNKTYWESLEPKERWQMRKSFYELQRSQDKLREDKRELEQKEYDERARFRKKFVEIMQSKGKRVAFYFVDQFHDFRNKKKQRMEGRYKQEWIKASSGKAGPTDRPALGKQPHILFILADDYGYHDIGYHMAEVLTPTLDKLANDGVKLEQYYVQPVCTPTRSQLMTGRYQIRTGMQHGVIRPPQPDGVPLDEVLLPQALKMCGYNTEMVGKWHLGFFRKDYCPQNRGFDHFMGFYTGSEDFYTHTKCFSGMCGYDFREAYAPEANKPEVIRYDMNDTYSTGAFAANLHERLSISDPNVPLFTYLSFQAVHSPLQAPRKYIDIYRNMKNRKRRNYNAMVTAMDKAIYQVVKSYKQFEFWENTVLIFSSDNGGNVKAGASNWPLRGQKGSLYDGGIRSIGFVHSPLLPVNRMGSTSYHMMHVTDWFPTIMHLAGCQTLDFGGKPLDGVSQIRSIWAGGEEMSRTEILHGMDPLAEMKYYEDPRKYQILKDRNFKINYQSALRWNQWKLITGSPGRQTGWDVPPTKLHGNATSIFDEVVLPQEAYIDDIKANIDDMEITAEEKQQIRTRRKADLVQRRWLARTKRSTEKPVFTMSEAEAEKELLTGSHQKTSLQEKLEAKKAKQLARKKQKAAARKGKVSNIKPKDKMTKLVQLFDMIKDPTEKNELSDQYPKIVNIMLTKLADYYDASVPPRYPAFDVASDPALGDGVWRPWIKTEDELEFLTDADKEHYLMETEEKFTAIMDGDRLRIQLAEELIKNRENHESRSRQRKHGPQKPQLKLAHHSQSVNHTIIAEMDKNSRHNLHDAKKLARSFIKEEREIWKSEALISRDLQRKVRKWESTDLNLYHLQ